MTSWEVVQGDCLDVLRQLADDSIHAVVTDPPYELGFMGRAWDKSGIAYSVDLWREVLRVLKPGGYLLAFGGARTYHRMVVAIEDAGFVINPLLGWVYGSGFPKATDVGKQLDKQAGAEREVVGKYKPPCGKEWNLENDRVGGGLGCPESLRSESLTITSPATPEAVKWDGWKYSISPLKPALEPICMAMKPYDGKPLDSILEHEVGAVNVDGCRVPADYLSEPGRGEAWLNSGRDRKNLDRPCQVPNHKTLTVADRLSSLGRFPPNLCLDTCKIQIYSLTGSQEGDIISSEKRKLIEEYYNDYDLSTLRKSIRYLSEPSKGRERETLQSEVLRTSLETSDWSTFPPVGEAVAAGDHCADESSASQARQGTSPLQRELDVSGISHDKLSRVDPGSACPGSPDVTQGPERDSGASAGNGDSFGKALKKGGAGPSSKRGEGRQPNREFGVDDIGQSHPEPREPDKRKSETSERERIIEVLVSDIPASWMKYFEPTGKWLFGGGAEAVGRMSGESVSSNRPRNNSPYDGNKMGHFDAHVSAGFSDAGDCSRFFPTFDHYPEPPFCSLCTLTMVEKHGTMIENNEEISCRKNANGAGLNSPPTKREGGFALIDVQLPGHPESGDRSVKLRQPAQDAGPSSPTSQATGGNIAPPNVLTMLEKRIAQNAKYAGSLCDSCATAFARSLVAIKQGRSPESLLGLGFITDSKKSILIDSLVSFAELWESTDTTPTMRSLTLLFGSVQNATSLFTTRERSAGNETGPMPVKYNAKASRGEREAGLGSFAGKSVGTFAQDEWSRQNMGNTPDAERQPVKNPHPTVKPIALMRWLIRLVTREGQTCLDPFMGSGTTGCAAALEGRDFLGIEREEEYIAIAEARIAHWASQEPPDLYADPPASKGAVKGKRKRKGKKDGKDETDNS